MKMKHFNFQNLLLSSAIFATSSAINFNPSTGLTDYPSVEITKVDDSGHDPTITVPLKTVKMFSLDLATASDPISEDLFSGLDIPPSLVILSGMTTKLGDGSSGVRVYYTEISRLPNNATNTVCKLIPSEPEPDDRPFSEYYVWPGPLQVWNDYIDGIHCTSYFLVDNALSELEERIENPKTGLRRLAYD